jgi:hypothetical protein
MAGQQTDEHGYSAQRRKNAIAYGTKWEPVVEHDTDPIPRQYKYIFCLTAGTAVMKDVAGTTLTLTLAANEVLPIVPTYLLVASTGAFIGVIE